MREAVTSPPMARVARGRMIDASVAGRVRWHVREAA